MDILEEIAIAQQQAEASNSDKELPKQFPESKPDYPADKGLAWMMMTVPMVVAVVVGCSLLAVKILDYGGAYVLPLLLFTIVVIGMISFFVLRSATKVSDKKLLKGFVHFSRKIKTTPGRKHK